MQPILIAGRNPGPFTGAGTNTYLIPGEPPTLIDAGAGHPDHLAELDRHLTGPRSSTALRVVLTHGHPDHASGAARLLERFPQATVLKFPWPDRDPALGVPMRPLVDDQPIAIGAGTLRVVHTPGHSPDHVCLFETRSGTMFTGDLVQRDGSIALSVANGGRVSDYLASLERLLALAPVRLLPGHGPPIDDPAPLLRSYIEHRLMREREILSHLSRGPSSVLRFVEAIYPELPDALRAVAAGTVEAHLIKLEDEGQAVRDGASWRAIG